MCTRFVDIVSPDNGDVDDVAHVVSIGAAAHHEVVRQESRGCGGCDRGTMCAGFRHYGNLQDSILTIKAWSTLTFLHLHSE